MKKYFRVRDSKLEEINDDRLSPMTYKKLKELGYGHEQWKNLTQEQANKIVEKNTESNDKPSSNKTEKAETKQKPSETKLNKAEPTEASNPNKVPANKVPASIKLDKNMKYGSNPNLDKLVDSKGDSKRKQAAKLGYGLDKLVDDKYWVVRKEVAKQGYGLDKLVNDKDGSVRRIVAEQGYGLDKLVNDEDEYVRAAVARQGYGLDKLIDDKEWFIRAAVARQGYGFDKLINDEDEDVQLAAAEGYAKQNPKEYKKIVSSINMPKDADEATFESFKPKIKKRIEEIYEGRVDAKDLNIRMKWNEHGVPIVRVFRKKDDEPLSDSFIGVDEINKILSGDLYALHSSEPILFASQSDARMYSSRLGGYAWQIASKYEPMHKALKNKQ